MLGDISKPLRISPFVCGTRLVVPDRLDVTFLALLKTYLVLEATLAGRNDHFHHLTRFILYGSLRVDTRQTEFNADISYKGIKIRMLS